MLNGNAYMSDERGEKKEEQMQPLEMFVKKLSCPGAFKSGSR